MGRGLVIGTTRLFAAADLLLNAESKGELRSSPNKLTVQHAGVSSRLGAPTPIEVAEARAMLVRMGFLQARPEASRRSGS